jgi:hypothetical protein
MKLLSTSFEPCQTIKMKHSFCIKYLLRFGSSLLEQTTSLLKIHNIALLTLNKTFQTKIMEKIFEKHNT